MLAVMRSNHAKFDPQTLNDVFDYLMKENALRTFPRRVEQVITNAPIPT